jgi:CubicO group peptidase (beta-lactamase class C family)
MRLLSAVVLVAFVPPLFAQADRFAPVTERFEKFVADGDTAGAVLVVGRKDGVKYLKSVGLRDATAPTSKMTDGTLFRIASMTKPITAIAVMILQDEGKLSVDDPVEKHLPEFKGQLLITAIDKEKGTVTLGKPQRPIRLRDLLTHTSGLAAYPPGMADVYARRNYTLGETTAAVSQLALLSEPGSRWAYSNSGIDTLGRVVEVVSGQGYEKFLQGRIFDPLGMTDTTFFPTPRQGKRVAAVHDKKDGKAVAVMGHWMPLEFDGERRKHPIPAGGLFSTAADLARLYQLMLHKGELDGKRVLSEKAVAEMTRTQTGDIKTGFVDGMSFGYGWAVVKEPKGVSGMLSAGTFGHGGAFGTQAWIDPKQDAFFILLIQRTGLANGDASDMRRELQRLGVEALK